jgi:hypothetical protein
MEDDRVSSAAELTDSDTACCREPDTQRPLACLAQPRGRPARNVKRPAASRCSGGEATMAETTQSQLGAEARRSRGPRRPRRRAGGGFVTLDEKALAAARAANRRAR